MKRIAFALAALMVAFPAAADSISVTATTALASGGTRTKSFTISAADMQTAVNAAQSPCNVAINGTCTNDQVLDFISGWLMKQASSWVAQATTQTTTTQKNITIQ